MAARDGMVGRAADVAERSLVAPVDVQESAVRVAAVQVAIPLLAEGQAAATVEAAATGEAAATEVVEGTEVVATEVTARAS